LQEAPWQLRFSNGVSVLFIQLCPGTCGICRESWYSRRLHLLRSAPSHIGTCTSEALRLAQISWLAWTDLHQQLVGLVAPGRKGRKKPAKAGSSTLAPTSANWLRALTELR